MALAPELEARLSREAPLIKQAWQAMRDELSKVEMNSCMAPLPPAFSSCRIEKDPYDRSESLLADWYREGQVAGYCVIHGNGQIFAEYDIVRVHPQKPAIFIEAVTAWGRSQKLSAELRLLEMP